MKTRFKPSKPFSWSGPYDGCGGERWCCGHKDLNGLDVTVFKDGSGVSISTRSDELSAVCGGISNIQFADRDEAALVVLSLVRAHREAVARVPVPKEQHAFIVRQIGDLREQATALRTLCFQNRSQMRELEVVAKLLGLEDKIPSYSESKPEKLIARIDAFTLDCDKLPFFTEGKLYDLLGKDDARSVLALIAQVKRALDPVAAED